MTLMEEKGTKIDFKWVLEQLPMLLKIKLLVLSFAGGFEPVLTGVLLGQIVALNLSDSGAVVRYVIVALVLYLTNYTFLFLFFRCCQECTRVLNVSLKTLYFKRSVFKSLRASSEISNTLNDVIGVAKQIEQDYFESLFSVLQSTVILIISAIFILKTNLVLSTVYVLFSMPSLLPSRLGRKRSALNSSKWASSNEKMVLAMKDIFQGRVDIVNFRAWPSFFNKFKSVLAVEEQGYRDLNNFQYTMQFISWMFSIAALLLPIFIGLFFMENGLFGVTKSTIVTLTLTADSVVGGVRTLTRYQNKITGTAKLREIPSISAYHQDSSRPSIKTQDHTQSGLALKNVSIYRGNKLILENINMRIPEGGKAIITGPSGIGKSTLLRAISGGVELTAGNITLDGHPIDTDDFVLISQKTWLFNGTLRDNITLLQNYTDEEVYQVVKDVRLDNELGPNALDFRIVDGGSNLSGGQAQRIGIARGLLRNSPIFLLDEISSSLDQKNAEEIRKVTYTLPAIIVEVAHEYDHELAARYNIKVYNLSQHVLQLMS